MDRRAFLKSTALASAASAIGISTPMPLFAKENWRWDKAVC